MHVIYCVSSIYIWIVELANLSLLFDDRQMDVVNFACIKFNIRKAIMPNYLANNRIK